MSYPIATPDLLAAAANDVEGIGSLLSTANAAAAAPTTTLLAAAGDEVSAAVAALFSGHAQYDQALSARVAAFHDQRPAKPANPENPANRAAPPLGLDSGAITHQRIQPPVTWHAFERVLTPLSESAPRAGDDVADRR